MTTPVSTRPAMTRYSDFGIPASWYRVAWSSDLPSGAVEPLKYFGRDLVLYRTDDGRAVVLDAFCQHLGAHLGHGGVVDKDCVVCPFHGWSWNPNGQNMHIPYASKPVRRTVQSWPVRESNGMIWVWFDPFDGAPSFEISEVSELADGTFTDIDGDARRVWPNVAVHPLQPAENTADPAHIRYIHGAGVVPELSEFSAQEAVFSVLMRYVWGAGKETTWLTPDGPVEGLLHAESHGLGIVVTRYSGIWPAIQLTGCTPIDAHHSDFYTAVALKKGAEDDLQRRMTAHFFEAVQADFPIWEHMRWIEHPPLPRLEAKVMRNIRAWSKQFTDGTSGRPTA